MEKYAIMKRFHHDYRFQVYIYALIYGDLETIPVRNYFPAAQKIENYKKIPIQRPVLKYWLQFSFIHSKGF